LARRFLLHHRRVTQPTRQAPGLCQDLGEAEGRSILRRPFSFWGRATALHSDTVRLFHCLPEITPLTIERPLLYNPRCFMTEHYHSMTGLDPEQLGKALGAPAQPVHDVAYGDGQCLAVAAGRTTLEIYPAAGVARVTTQNARVELHRLPGCSTNDGRVVFQRDAEDERLRLVVRGDGKVALQPVLRGPEWTQDESSSPTTHTTVIPPSAAVIEPHSATHAAPAVETEEAPARVDLRGRLGRDPWFRRPEEDDQVLIGGFPLAINDAQGGKTTWHKVVVFGEHADALSASAADGKIRKGNLVDVAGVVQERKEPRRDGGTTTIREIHATTVVRVTSQRKETQERQKRR
jgi:Single-strand binding protein family